MLEQGVLANKHTARQIDLSESNRDSNDAESNGGIQDHHNKAAHRDALQG